MRYGGVPIRRSPSGFQRSAEDDGGNHNHSDGEECPLNNVSPARCKKCKEEVLEGTSGIMCDMCSGWLHGECSGLTKTAINVIGKVAACKWFCGGCLENVNDRLKCVSNNLEIKKDIDDIKRLVNSLNKPTYASKVTEKPSSNVTNVNETSNVNEKRRYPDDQTLYISGTIEDDVLASSVLQKRRLYTFFPGIKLDFTFTNKLGKIVLLFNNKECCNRVKTKWDSNLLGTDTRVYSPNESKTHRGIIREVPIEIKDDDIKNV